MSNSPLDAALPGLRVAMDRDAFLDILVRHLPECSRELEPTDARVVDVQYDAGSSAHVLWKLNFHDRGTGRTGRQLVFAQVLRLGDAMPTPPTDLIQRYQVLRGQKHAARIMPIRTPWLCVPELNLVFHAFPLDPALPTLIDAVNPIAMKAAMHRLWTTRRTRVRSVSVETLSYTPGQRAALRYEILSEDKDTGIPELRRLVGKINARRAPARLFAGHWAVWRSTIGRASIAPPTGYIATLSLSLQEFVSGERLSDLAGPGGFAGKIRATARSIASVHAQNLPLISERGAEKEISVVDRWIKVLTGLRPNSAARLQFIGKRLSQELAERANKCATVHGDFHLANMIANETDVTLIDWDQVARGDPMVDVGRLLASLRVSSLRINGKLAGLADAEEGFLRTYLDETKEDERRARLFEASSLLVAAAAPFRLQRAGWEESAELMLDEVERILDLSRAGARSSAVEQNEFPLAERVNWALNAPYAQALLVPIVQTAYGPDTEVIETQARLLESSDRRLHVRYKLKGFKGGDRWSANMEAVGLHGDSGRGRLRRLTLVNEALADQPKTLQLPRALGHIGPLNLQVLSQPMGKPLLGALEGEGAEHAAAALGRALAEFHRLQIDLAKERETRADISAVRRRVLRLGEDSHPLAARAKALLQQIEERATLVGERRSPTIRGLNIKKLRFDGMSVGATLIDDVLLGEPLLSAGEISAQMQARVARNRLALPLADRFQQAYLVASGETDEALRTFEALALLRYACRRARTHAGDQAAVRMLDAVQLA